MNRPNILFAIADDASHMGAHDDTFVKTPAFDRVCRDGVRFSAAFTTNPKCAPSRASILTGRHTWQLEEAANHYSVFPAKFAVYPDLLEAAGYHVGHTGKGWAPGDFKAGGFARNPAGPEWNARKLTPPAGSRVSDCDYTANLRDFLDAAAPGQPFCFWYGGREPHRPYTPGEGARHGKKPAEVVVPPYLPDDDTVRGDLCDYAFEVEWFDRQLGQMLAELERRGRLANTLVVVTSDNGMPFPRVKGQMYECDFRLPLAVMWAGRVPGGRTSDDLVSFTDFAPTFLDAAGLAATPGMAGRSLLPILERPGNGVLDPSRDHVVMGRERHDLGRENDLGYPVRCLRERRYLYVRNLAPERWPAGNPETGFTNCDSSPTKTRVLELQEQGDDRYYRLAFGKRPAEELYDIVTDEPCLHNLAGDPRFEDLRRRMAERLARILRETGDPRSGDNGDVFERYPCTGNDAHSWKALQEGRFRPQTY
jgi:arylsulfatase A-like enzyme